MAAQSLTYSYKETRIDLDPTATGSTVTIRLPSSATSTSLSRPNQKRSNFTEVPTAEDEIAFRQKHLASAASIYHRRHFKSPRSFLWRILEDGRVLSIRVVDISRQGSVPDAHLTLHLILPRPILPSCIALSDSKEHDVLSVFILTESKQLLTLSLRPDYFRRPSSTEDNSGDWCKIYVPKSLTIKNPHRLVALSTDDLLISFHDGALVQLSRASGGDGSSWKEQQYNEGGWGHSFRSMVPFHGNSGVRYGKHYVQPSAATSLAWPVIVIDGTRYSFTVTIDHRLRVWNLALGKIAYIGDMLTQELEPQDEPHKVIDPSQAQLIQTISHDQDSAICVTYSPLGSGQFKFWKVTSSADGNLRLHDLFPDNSLVPPAPTSDIWTMADFDIVSKKINPEKFILWALWKNNVTYRLHKLEIQTGSIASVRNAWNGSWDAVAGEFLREIPLPTSFSGDSSDVTEKWLELILTPGRFTRPTIETGLSIYEQGLGSKKDKSRKSSTMAERLCTTIASAVALVRMSDGTMDFEQFRSAIDFQWRRFYRLLDDLDKQRGEALSLVIDPEGEMPWVILADGITAIRSCSELEKIWHNPPDSFEESKFIARPISAAAIFRQSLPEQFILSCQQTLLEELFQEPAATDAARLRQFYEKCDFANHVGDEEYGQLLMGLGGHFKDLTPEVYETMITILSSAEDSNGVSDILPLTEYGNKLLLKGAQEIINLNRKICLEQLILLVLVESEINHEDEGLHFETATVFSRLTSILMQLELMHWLSSTNISLPLKKSERFSSTVDTSPSLGKEEISGMETITVFEGVLRHLFGLGPQDRMTMPSTITKIILQPCAAKSIFIAPTAVIQCFLLRNGRPDLAMEFSRFTGRDPFSTYVQGRACLAANDALTASLLFREAAFGMASPDPKQKSDHHSAGFLQETEKTLLNAGLPQYYSHIVALFDKEKHYSFVIDFARLSLQFIPFSVEAASLRTEMHLRLFHAAINTARFESAYSAMILLTDPALQHSSLRTLVFRMSESSYASQLIEFPFLGLQDKVDDILNQKCRSIVDVASGVPYHKILYAWRIKRNNFRGAAAISMERLLRLQQSSDGDRVMGDDGLETPVTQQYVALINTLSCVDPQQAWILSEELSPTAREGIEPVQPKRKVVTLADVRRSYQEELDRIAAIHNNQFAFGDDEMDVF